LQGTPCVIKSGGKPPHSIRHRIYEQEYLGQGRSQGRRLQFLQRPADSLSLIERTDQMEAEIIKAALDRFHWNKSKTADHLGLKRTTLQYKIKKYGLE